MVWISASRCRTQAAQFIVWRFAFILFQFVTLKFLLFTIKFVLLVSCNGWWMGIFCFMTFFMLHLCSVL